MSIHGGVKLVFLGVCATVALAVAGSRAQASCGDYVMIGGNHLTPSNAATTAAGNTFAPRGKQIPCPCRGAECSQPPMPWSPTPAPQSVQTERDPLVANQVCQLGESLHRAGSVAEMPCRAAAFTATDIFRPPQASL